jgi:ABC-type sugar transport system ATPase subunit
MKVTALFTYLYYLSKMSKKNMIRNSENLACSRNKSSKTTFLSLVFEDFTDSPQRLLRHVQKNTLAYKLKGISQKIIIVQKIKRKAKRRELLQQRRYDSVREKSFASSPKHQT